jgi:hypothetical protein
VNVRVEGKFHCRKMFGPVFLTFVTEEMKILLYFLVLALDFAISFWVISSNEAGFYTKTFIECMHKLGHKLGAVIGEDFFRNSVKMEDIPIMKIGSALGCQVGLARDKVSLIKVVIHVDHNGVKVVRGGQLRNKIDANMLPRSSRDFLRLQDSFGVLCRLIALALLTTQDIFVYKQGHLRPPVETRHQF